MIQPDRQEKTTKNVASVVDRARAVSMPIPEEQPVMSMVFEVSFPVRFSSWIIWRAVGRASPGPWGFWCAAKYFEGAMVVVVRKRGDGNLTLRDCNVIGRWLRWSRVRDKAMDILGEGKRRRCLYVRKAGQASEAWG